MSRTLGYEESIEAVLAAIVGSTMDAAKEYARWRQRVERPIAGIIALFAREQTHGRGRAGARWLQADTSDGAHATKSGRQGVVPDIEMPPAPPLDPAALQTFRSFSDALVSEQDFLPVTFIVPAQLLRVPPEWLSSVVGCALIDALRATADFVRSTFLDLPLRDVAERSELALKWPNDIVFQPTGQGFRKVAGILCETSVSGQEFHHFYIGLGLNALSTPSLPVAASFWDWLVATNSPRKSSRHAVQKWLARPEVRRAFLSRLLGYLERELIEYLTVPRSTGQLKGLTLQRSLPLGTRMQVNKGTQSGKFTGLADNGALLIEGYAEPILAADVVPLPDAPVTPLKRAATPRGSKAPAATASTTASVAGTAATNLPHATSANSLAAGPAAVTSDSKVTKVTPLLAFDVGNTRLHWLLMRSGDVTTQGHFLHAGQGPLDFAPEFKPLLAALAVHRQGTLRLAYTSVASTSFTLKLLAEFSAFLFKLLPELKLDQCEFRAKDILVRAGLAEQYDVNTLGPDRALRFHFAARQARTAGAAVGIVACGTALTCEVVSAEGTIVESLITPGLQMALDALSHFTARLPALKWDDAATKASPEGWTTAVSMQRGAAWPALALLGHLARTHALDTLFLTGGNAAGIKRLLEEAAGEFQCPCKVSVHDQLESRELASLWEDEPAPPPGGPGRGLQTLLGRKEAASVGATTEAPEDDLLPELDDERMPKSSGVIRSMLRARARSPSARTLAPRPEDFRKLGGRIENIGLGERFDRFLSQQFPFHTREMWRSRISSREVLVQHAAPRFVSPTPPKKLAEVKPTYRLQQFDQVWVFHPPEYEPDVVETCEVVFDDADTVVFSKPGNLVIHAAGLYGKNTFIGWAHRHGFADAAPVHRIDRETSGLLVCARKVKTRTEVSLAFRQGEMRKMYFAVCKAEQAPPTRFRVALPIGDCPGSRIRLKLWVNGPNSLEALTHFECLARWQDYSLLACFPKTGRTNQIRIHLAAIGQWIVGDKMYHPSEEVFLDFYERGLTPTVLERAIFPRHLLHNAAIQGPASLVSALGQGAVVCPFTHDMHEFEPFRQLLASLQLTSREDEARFIKETFERLMHDDFGESPCLEALPSPVT